jgi:hypothetical protein
MTSNISPPSNSHYSAPQWRPDLRIVYQKFEITVANTRLMLLGSEES